MTLYQQKTIPFEAIQWNTNNYEDVKTFTNGSVALTADNLCLVVNGETICENDWILKFIGKETGSGNEVTRLSFCSDAVFQESYEQYQGLQ